MSGTDLRELFKNRAAGASMPPADLMDRVEAGHRRRRRGQVAVAAFAAVVALTVGAWAGLSPAQRRADTPATVNLPPFKLPAKLGQAPSIALVFPGSVFDDVPARTPSDGIAAVVGRIDSEHLVIADRKSFYAYDTKARTFRTITAVGEPFGNLTVAPHWILWELIDAHDSGHFFVYRAPLAGGPRQLVAEVRQNPHTTAWYATDDYLYWSKFAGDVVARGVTRLSLDDGNVARLAGFDDLVVDGTPWAKAFTKTANDGASAYLVSDSRTTALRNLVTGETRRVGTRSDTDTLRCVPTFCLGRVKWIGPSPSTSTERVDQLTSGYFVQHLDGSDRTELGYRSEPDLLKTETGGMIIFQGVIVLDPLTGRLGASSGPEQRVSCGGASGRGIEWSNQSEVSGPDRCRPSKHYAFFP
jgi:hypothetical protein